MARPRIDYDAIAALYDEPARDYRADRHLAEWHRERSVAAARRVRVLDIGCGTGKQLAANRDLDTSTLFVGVDRSIGMLRIAATRAPSIHWVHGDGTTLPFHADAFDYVTCQFAHAHIADKRALIQEAYRVLTTGGRFMQMNIDPWAMPDWLLYRYFPPAQERDHEDFVTAETLISHLNDAGFRHVRVERQIRTDQVPLADFLALVSSRHRASHLTALDDTDYEAGVSRVASDVAKYGGGHLAQSTVCLMTYLADQ